MLYDRPIYRNSRSKRSVDCSGAKPSISGTLSSLNAAGRDPPQLCYMQIEHLLAAAAECATSLSLTSLTTVEYNTSTGIRLRCNFTFKTACSSSTSVISLYICSARQYNAIARYICHRPSVCLSFCPSHGWISQRRLKLGSCNLHHRVAP